MTPLRLSHIWYRRLYVALFVLSVGYIAAYFLQQYSATPTPDSARIDALTLYGSAFVAISAVVLFLLAKKVSSFLPALLVYVVLAIITALLIQKSGDTTSLYIAPWALLVFIAPIFGAYGWLPVLIAIGSFVALEYLNGPLSLQTLISATISTMIPLGIGLLAWRSPRGTEETASTKNVKSLATQLSEVAAKSEIIINAIGDGVIAVDGKGVVQLINPAAQEILGWGKQDSLMLSYKSILKLSDNNNQELSSQNDPIEQVLNTNQQTRGGKITATTNSGKKINISLVVSPIGDRGAGAIAVFRDVTNERAEEREQAEFISTASHEMRTPVASIEGYLGLALNPATATVDAKARDYIMKAHESAEHLGRLFQDLLDVSKSEDGRMQNMPRVVNIVPFTETIVQGLQQKAIDKNLELTFVPTTSQAQRKIMPVYYVNLDNDHVREVLDNLIENAVKYTPQGQVTVDVTGTEDTVVISIKDTGLGIPPEDIPHLFQKFYRVSNIDRQSIGGTGLGLYLSRRLVEAMQGRLWVESVFGSGSTFFVEFPRVDNQEAERLKSEQAAQIAQAAKQSSFVAAASAVTEASVPQVVAGSQPSATQPQIAPQAPVQTPQTQIQVQPQPQPTQPQAPAFATTPGVRPATTVPRGETLSRDQINERVRQLEALAKQQRAAPTERQ